MLATTQAAPRRAARQRWSALWVAGGILYVIGFGAPNLLLGVAHGLAGSGFVGPA
jgi:hypothetical protein